MGMYGRTTGTSVADRHQGTDIDTGVSMTKQSFREESDINQIIKRFEKTGMITVAQREGFFGDVSDIRDYKEAVDLVQRADALFMEMSAEIRARFDNDPEKMVLFLDDEANRAEAEELGMIARREVVRPPIEPVGAPVVPAVPVPPVGGV